MILKSVLEGSSRRIEDEDTCADLSLKCLDWIQEGSWVNVKFWKVSFSYKVSTPARKLSTFGVKVCCSIKGGGKTSALARTSLRDQVHNLRVRFIIRSTCFQGLGFV